MDSVSTEVSEALCRDVIFVTILYFHDLWLFCIFSIFMMSNRSDIWSFLIRWSPMDTAWTKNPKGSVLTPYLSPYYIFIFCDSLAFYTSSLLQTQCVKIIRWTVKYYMWYNYLLLFFLVDPTLLYLFYFSNIQSHSWYDHEFRSYQITNWMCNLIAHFQYTFDTFIVLLFGVMFIYSFLLFDYLEKSYISLAITNDMIT